MSAAASELSNQLQTSKHFYKCNNNKKNEYFFVCPDRSVSHEMLCMHTFPHSELLTHRRVAHESRTLKCGETYRRCHHAGQEGSLGCLVRRKKMASFSPIHNHSRLTTSRKTLRATQHKRSKHPVMGIRYTRVAHRTPGL